MTPLATCSPRMGANDGPVLVPFLAPGHPIPRGQLLPHVSLCRPRNSPAAFGRSGLSLR